MTLFSDKSKEYDKLSMFMMPSEWETPVEYAQSSLKMPKPVNWNNIAFYSIKNDVEKR